MDNKRRVFTKQIATCHITPPETEARNRSVNPPVWAVVSAAALLMVASPAFAGLGENASSVATDQAHFQGAVRTRQAQSYSVEEIQPAGGTTVREYVSASGKVFGVAWQGPWYPDLRQLLASYFTQYQQAAQAQASSQRGRRPLFINVPGLVVESRGHLRAFSGRAYIPDQLPQGVTAGDIR